MTSFISPKILEEKESKINGKLVVVKSLGLGTYIQAQGLTQSGGVVTGIWDKTIRVIKKNKKDVANCLILGLGGGTVARLISKHFPRAKITGVDIDPDMIFLGKKYLGLGEVMLKTEIGDAGDYIKNAKKNSFDLIIVDTYQGDGYPEKFEKEEFLKNINKVLGEGVVVFNRLYYDRKRPLAVKFSGVLRKVFGRVDAFYPEANVMFICSKN